MIARKTYKTKIIVLVKANKIKKKQSLINL